MPRRRFPYTPPPIHKKEISEPPKDTRIGVPGAARLTRKEFYARKKRAAKEAKDS